MGGEGVMGIIAVYFPSSGSLEFKFGPRFPNGYRPPSSVMTLDAHLLWTQTRMKRSGLANDLSSRHL